MQENPDLYRYALSRRSQRLRLFGASAVRHLPYGAYKQLVGLVKRNAGAAYRMPDAVEPAIGEARVWLTQDIDTAACYQHLPALLDLQEQRGLRSTSHFLTRGPYRIQAATLDAIEARGFEVGLHGDWHDAAFGFRPARAIRRRLAECRDALGRPLSSYRAPALAISEALLGHLVEAGFRVDSSIPARVFYQQGVLTTRPYAYPGIGITEVPLALQDVHILSDQSWPEPEIHLLWDRLIARVAAENGVLVFNAHPVHVARHLPLYARLLDRLCQHPSVRWVKGSAELVVATA